jgi:hypothetical protein
VFWIARQIGVSKKRFHQAEYLFRRSAIVGSSLNIHSGRYSERIVCLRIIDAPPKIAFKENVMRKLVLSLATITAFGLVAAPAMAHHRHHHHHHHVVIIKH